MEKRGILLIGHGSRLEHYTQFIADTAQLMQDKEPDSVIQTCFLEYSSPSIPEGLSLLKKENVDIIVAVPLLLAKGVHVLQNIPEKLGLELDTGRTDITLENGKTIPLVYAEPIGADPLLAELLLKNADNARK